MNSIELNEKVYNHINKVNSFHRKVTSLEKIEETIKEVQWVLGFQKIIAFSWWWQGLKIDDNNLSKELKKYSTSVKTRLIDNIMKRLKDYDVAILTWWTNWDIPRIATKIARKYNLPTIWVLPKRWEKNSLGKENLNIEIIVNPIYGKSHYGDESSIFAKLADGIIVIGWWSGTLIEFSHAIKINEASLKNSENLKKIIPMEWISGVSDTLHYIPGNDEVKKKTFPWKRISKWKDAFEWLRQELNLDDILKSEEFIKYQDLRD